MCTRVRAAKRRVSWACSPAEGCCTIASCAADPACPPPGAVPEATRRGGASRRRGGRGHLHHDRRGRRVGAFQHAAEGQHAAPAGPRSTSPPASSQAPRSEGGAGAAYCRLRTASPWRSPALRVARRSSPLRVRSADDQAEESPRSAWCTLWLACALLALSAAAGVQSASAAGSDRPGAGLGPASAATAPAAAAPTERRPDAATWRWPKAGWRAPSSASGTPTGTGTTPAWETANATPWPRSGTSCRCSSRSTRSRSRSRAPTTWRRCGASPRGPSAISTTACVHWPATPPTPATAKPTPRPGSTTTAGGGLAFVNAYRATGTRRYLHDAERALRYIAGGRMGPQRRRDLVEHPPPLQGRRGARLGHPAGDPAVCRHALQLRPRAGREVPRLGQHHGLQPGQRAVCGQQHRRHSDRLHRGPADLRAGAAVPAAGLGGAVRTSRSS